MDLRNNQHHNFSMTPQEFAQKVKSQYPQYQGIPDSELTNKIIEKYPVYKSQVSMPTPSSQSFTDRAVDKTASVLDTVFGGGKIGEAIGTKIAEARATPEERAAVAEFNSDTFEGPTGRELAGDALRIGATFIPTTKLAGVASKGLQAAGVGSKLASVAGSSIAGATAGLAADTGLSMSEGGGPTVGLGTTVGAGIPIVAPVLGAISRGVGKLTGKIASETQGAITGTSAETIEQAFVAAKKGGTELDTFTQALRGKTTPEQLVNNIRDSVSTVNTQRQTLFRETLAQLGDTPVNTTPAKQAFIDNLESAGVTIGDTGLDFTNSKLRLVPAAQSKLQTAFTDLMNTPQSAFLEDVDTTRQALKALSMAGDDPSANLANKLLDDAVRSVRDTASKQVPGYGKMLNQFAETSEFLDELQRGLATGDRATVDQTYRRMATALKTNNEARLHLLEELDSVTDGSILSSIAGQQLSETLPRGIFRQIAAGVAGGSVITGGAPSALLGPLVLASPRVTGEFVRALGVASAQADEIAKAVNSARDLLIKIGAISASVQDNSNQE
jgi:hypothetical protein